VDQATEIVARFNYDWYHTLAGVGLCPHTPKPVVVTTTATHEKPMPIAASTRWRLPISRHALECRENRDPNRLTTETVESA
jgi:hypothetical protein